MTVISKEEEQHRRESYARRCYLSGVKQVVISDRKNRYNQRLEERRRVFLWRVYHAFCVAARSETYFSREYYDMKDKLNKWFDAGREPCL